ANVARHASEAVTLDLRFLASLGLYPVVVLGLFESTEAMEQAVRLGRRLERAGVRALLLGAHEPDAIERATAATRAQTIPIVTFAVGAEARFETLAALVAALRTRKLIFLHRPGGLRQAGTLVPIVNLTTDYTALAQSKELSRKERVLVDESRKLVERTPHRLSIAITSPLNLFRELFTIKGAGTLLRRGAIVERRDFGDVDRERLRALLTRSFGRPPVDDFFSRPIARAYVATVPRGDAPDATGTRDAADARGATETRGVTEAASARVATETRGTMETRATAEAASARATTEAASERTAADRAAPTTDDGARDVVAATRAAAARSIDASERAQDPDDHGWRGAALVVETPLGAYLSKFAVDAEAQGEGIGRDLWQALASDYPRIFWRARAANAIGPWYVKLCDGMMRFAEWHVFWIGLPPDDIPAALAYTLAQPVDLP
ncbi:MAG TPA: hypothetical protein VIA18_26350, partial [Polyangia bacterium]|nr:hypothetical protein [Polyangia bacterium]